MLDQMEVEAKKAHYKQLIVDWYDAFEVPVNFELQNKLIREEALEVLKVFQENPQPTVEALEEFLKETSDLAFTLGGFQIMIERSETVPPSGLPDIETKLLVVTATDLISHVVLVNPEVIDALIGEAFERVCASNMTKLGEDGKPVRNEDGKVTKGPNYLPPYLTDLAEKILDELA